MNIEIEREAFEAWWSDGHPGDIARHDDGDYVFLSECRAWEAWQAGRAALREQPAEPVSADVTLINEGDMPAETAPSNAEIRDVFLANGFEIKPGHDDLKPYVYDAARALLAVCGAAAHIAEQAPSIAHDPSETEALKIIGYYADMRLLAHRNRASKKEVNDAWGDIKSLLARYGQAAQQDTDSHDTDVTDDVAEMLELLDNNEWAEHTASTDLGQRLEAHITALIGQQDADTVDAQPDEDLKEVNFLMQVFVLLDTWRAEDWNELLERNPPIADILRSLLGQPDPAMAGDDLSDDEIRTAIAQTLEQRGLDCDDDAASFNDVTALADTFRALLKRVQPASRNKA